MADRKAEWVAIAVQHLGPIADNKLVSSLLYWIDEEDLWMALEASGLVNAGKGTLVPASEVAESVLDSLRKRLI